MLRLPKATLPAELRTTLINQLGAVQPIGAVNEKIEGFFEICSARGLTGDQGVIIPSSNVPNLMLRPEVVSAVRQGVFNIYAIDDVDQAIETLTGVPAGQAAADGSFPPESVNQRVLSQLLEFAIIAQSFEKLVKVEIEPSKSQPEKHA